MPLRTRACSICRKKRIKCDLTLPHCRMCRLSGHDCPGPLEGLLLVDMTASAKNGMRRPRKPQQQPNSYASGIQLDRVATRASVQAGITKAFFENFLTHFVIEGEQGDIQNKLTWLQRLPDLASTKSDNALVLALEATATAYGAIMSSSTAMTQDARDLYGTALRAYHDMLQKSDSNSVITIHMVSTSVLLSFFEAMQATSADAYRSHIYGAAKLLEFTGPGQCAQGVLCQLFYHVRTQMLFVQLASDQNEIPTSTKRILFDTLRYKDPPLIQRLMCSIAALRESYTWTRNSEQTRKHRSLKMQVDQLWDEYSSRSCTKCLVQQETAAGTVAFNEAFAALTVAYFSLAYILLAVLGPDAVDSKDLTNYSQVILDDATYLDVPQNAIAFMRMATPLLSVALHAPSPGHREEAIKMFTIWSKSSMRGISALALNAVRGQRGIHAGKRQGSQLSASR